MALEKKSVIIIGAGISGLAAAQELAKHPSIEVKIIEARDRIGGRINTRRNLVPPGQNPILSSIPIDFGASWIHGVSESNPIVSIAEAGLSKLVHTNKDVIYTRPGHPPLRQEESNHYWTVVWDIFQRAQEYAARHRERIGIETSFKDWLDQYLKSRQSKDPGLPNYMSEEELRIVPLLVLFWADENAIPLNKVSLKYMDAEEMPPGDHSIMANGYDRVLEIICEDLKQVPIYFEHIVDRIEYNESNVKVSTNKGTFTADVVLVTLPLGVLKSNAVTFSPPLPERKQNAIRRLGFGTMVKIVVYFPFCFWPKEQHFINFLPTACTKPNPALTGHLNRKQMAALKSYMNDLANYSSLMPIHNAPILIGYAANESADAFEKLTDEEAMEVVLCQLAHYFAILVKDPVATRPTHSFMTRWCADPFARGSYTSILTGSCQSDLAEFEIPVGATASTTTVATFSTADTPKTLATYAAAVSAQAKTSPIPTGTVSLLKKQPARLNSERRSDQDNNHQRSNSSSSDAGQRGASIDDFVNQLRVRNGHGHVATAVVPPPRVVPLAKRSQMGTLVSYSHSNALIQHHQHPLRVHPAALRLHGSTGTRNTLGYGQPLPSSATVVTLPLPSAPPSFYSNTLLPGHKITRPSSIPIKPSNPIRVDPRSKSWTIVLSTSPPSHNKEELNPQTKARNGGPSVPVSISTASNLTKKKQILVAVDDVVRGRIHFAGEHTTPTSFASVHGALMTGRREAAKILGQKFQSNGHGTD